MGVDEEVLGDVELSEVEVKARDLGWKPQDEFKGDPEKWRSAEEFMHRADTVAPLLKNRVDKLERQLDEQHRHYEQQIALQRTIYESQVNDLKEQRKEAIQIGDTEAVEALDEKLDEVKSRLKETKAPEAAPQLSPELQAFAQKHNHWIDKDAELTQDVVAIGQSLRVKQQQEGWTEKEFVVHLERRMRDLHGDRLDPPRSRASVEGGTKSAPRGAKGDSDAVETKVGMRSYKDLPPEAKAACESMIGTRMFKGKTPEEARKFYVQNYIW